MSIKVDQNTCIGCGTCAATCEESYAINAEGKAEFVKESACANNAIEACPVKAISA